MAAEPDGKLDRRILTIASVVVLGAIMSILDTTVVNVAINTLARDFHTELSTLQGRDAGYTRALATVIPLRGCGAALLGPTPLHTLSLRLFVRRSAVAGRAG